MHPSYNHELSLFNGVVKAMAGRYKADSLHNSQDIEQECWLKIWQVKSKLDTMPPDEATVFAHVAIKNHVAGIVNKSRVRSHLNRKLKPKAGSFSELQNLTASPTSEGSEEINLQDIMDNMIQRLDGSMPMHRLTQEQITSYRKLVDELLAWSNDQSGTTRKLVQEMIEPGDNTLTIWEQMTERHPAYKSYPSIPPSSFSDILGCSKITISRIIHRMREHLEELGYGREYLLNAN
jgi:hypothetical protein